MIYPNEIIFFIMLAIKRVVTHSSCGKSIIGDNLHNMTNVVDA